MITYINISYTALERRCHETGFPSQSELMKKLGRSHNYFNINRNDATDSIRIRREYLEKLCSELMCTPEYLQGKVDKPNQRFQTEAAIQLMIDNEQKEIDKIQRMISEMDNQPVEITTLSDEDIQKLCSDLKQTQCNSDSVERNKAQIEILHSTINQISKCIKTLEDRERMKHILKGHTERLENLNKYSANNPLIVESPFISYNPIEAFAKKISKLSDIKQIALRDFTDILIQIPDNHADKIIDFVLPFKKYFSKEANSNLSFTTESLSDYIDNLLRIEIVPSLYSDALKYLMGISHQAYLHKYITTPEQYKSYMAILKNYLDLFRRTTNTRFKNALRGSVLAFSDFKESPTLISTARINSIENSLYHFLQCLEEKVLTKISEKDYKNKKSDLTYSQGRTFERTFIQYYCSTDKIDPLAEKISQYLLDTNQKI